MIKEYPHLPFKKHWNLTTNALVLLGQCEAYVQAINNTPILPHHYQQLMSIALMKGAQATTAIEGNTLSDDEIQKIMQKEKLPPSKEYQEIEVRNILDGFNELLHEIVDEDIDHYISIDLLKRFHVIVGKDLGEHFDAIPGRLRKNSVVVGKYKCPEHEDIPILLEKLCKWLIEEFKYGKKGQTFSEVVVQAIVTHIYIEWIHPFGDGNGRTGRLTEFYILLRGGNPDIASHILSNYYNLTRNEYYRQIQKANDQRDLSEFIEYALLGFCDGLVNILETIQKSQFENTWQKLIYDKFDSIRDQIQDDVFKRQRTLALDFPKDRKVKINEVSELSIPVAKLYASISEKTILRDLERLITLELVKKEEGGYITNTSQLRGMIAKRRKV